MHELFKVHTLLLNKSVAVGAFINLNAGVARIHLVRSPSLTIAITISLNETYNIPHSETLSLTA